VGVYRARRSDVQISKNNRKNNCSRPASNIVDLCRPRRAYVTKSVKNYQGQEKALLSLSKILKFYLIRFFKF
jgi:hypothetical protein